MSIGKPDASEESTSRFKSLASSGSPNPSQIDGKTRFVLPSTPDATAKDTASDK